MKCSNCGYELIKLNNWKAVYTGDVQRAYFKTFTLFAARFKDSFMKGVGFKEVTPSFMVCRQCGKLELYLDRESLQTILNIEADDDYSKSSRDETHNNNEQTINLTRMSKLRRSQNMNTMAQNVETVNLTRMSHMRRRSQMQ
jgi:hypothetical protein